MYFTELLTIMGLLVLIWLWLENMKINESARRIGKNLCEKNNVQFLDDTVQLSSMRIAKNNFGQYKLIRRYKFEFTNSEYHRYEGEILLAGKQLQKTHMDVYRLD